MNRALIAIFTMLLVQGCAGDGHKEFYSQVAPTKYPPTERAMVFAYENVNLKEIYDLLFSDFLIIGRSAFNGPYENPENAVTYAKSIGADVFLCSAQFKETRTSFMYLSSPTSSTTSVSGYSGTGSFYATATTYGTQTTTVPLRVDRYDQSGLYLKNVNSVVPLWERTEAQYQKTDQSDVEGVWVNEKYNVNLYRSGQQYVAFISGEPKDRGNWRSGQLKFIYGVDSGIGVYLMGNKTPMPAKFTTNKFGHFEVTLIATATTFSFKR